MRVRYLIECEFMGPKSLMKQSMIKAHAEFMDQNHLNVVDKVNFVRVEGDPLCYLWEFRIDLPHQSITNVVKGNAEVCARRNGFKAGGYWPTIIPTENHKWWKFW